MARKICYCICFAASILPCIIFGALHADRSINAQNMNNLESNVPKLPTLDIYRDATLYDTCRHPTFVNDRKLMLLDARVWQQINEEYKEYCKWGSENCLKGTQWSVAFRWNSIVLLLSAANFIVLTFGAFYLHARIIGTWLNFFYACLHCTACTMAISVAYSPLGRHC